LVRDMIGMLAMLTSEGNSGYCLVLEGIMFVKLYDIVKGLF
jgi:hypothetical protein